MSDRSYLVTIELERAVLAAQPGLPALLKDRLRCAADAEEIRPLDIVVSERTLDGEDAAINAYPPEGYADSSIGIAAARAVLPRLEDLAADLVEQLAFRGEATS